MQAKIALLAKLAFGQDIALDKVPCAGISNLSSADFACAKVGGWVHRSSGTYVERPEKRRLLYLQASSSRARTGTSITMLYACPRARSSLYCSRARPVSPRSGLLRVDDSVTMTHPIERGSHSLGRNVS